jgi:DedD protein
MAFFKFRKGGDEQPAPPAPAESIEAMRRRAMHRLIGAAVLVVAGVIGFPLLFDSQPRPIAVDIPIQIPDRNKVKPPVVAMALPASAAPTSTAPAVAPEAASPVDAVKSAPAAVEAKPEVKAEAKPEPKVEPKVEAKIEPKVEAKIEPKAGVKVADAAKAQALLEARPVEKAADKPSDKSSANGSEGRYVVQVGAFADATRAKEARGKLEGAGLKTYTQVVDTKDGQRTRVRVGPFSAKDDAEKAARKIKTLDLPAAILTL